MKLNFATYRDKVHACWLGKNIGGTMGTPYEGLREAQDIQGFSTQPGKPLPNDDLDLQLIWLEAVERMGFCNVNAETLSEFWSSYIVPHWNEYGICKANARAGILPPMSGDYHNDWKHSNGAWIRTEIWAALLPGCPDIAAIYAAEDASVDHGTGEGTYAAMFVSAMQSAAYLIPDLRTCIDIALTKIPESSRIAKTVLLAIACYESGVPVREARDRILESNADLGNGWFEAPSNVGYAILGLLYGEGDFKKSMIYAINCGDDTDCTGATVGATLGILGGTAVIPADWQAHIGNEIVTVSINRGLILTIPLTCEELTDRVTRQARGSLLYPAPMHQWIPNIELEKAVELTDGETEIPDDLVQYYRHMSPALSAYLSDLLPNSVKAKTPYFTAVAAFPNGIDITPGCEIPVKLCFRNREIAGGNIPHRLTLRWWLPDGFEVKCARSAVLTAFADHPGQGIPAEIDATITVGNRIEAHNRIVLEVRDETRPTAAYLPITLQG